MARLVVTRRLPEEVEARASASHDVLLNSDDRELDARDLIAICERERPEGLLVAPTDALTAEVIGALPDTVRIIATFSVGHDHIDIAAAEARGIAVTNTPDVLTEATADVAMLCVLGAARKAHEAEMVLRSGRWGRWAPTEFLGRELFGATLGILGMGRIGRATARRAAGFGMKVIYWNRSPVSSAVLAADGIGTATAVGSIDELLSESDILSLHAALGAETRRIIDATRISRMRPGAILVNTARGGLVDDAAVLAALDSGQIGAIGFDVFEGEPDLNPGYLQAPNAFLLPHIGSATVHTRNQMGFAALDNIDAVFAGRAPVSPVGSPA